MNATVRASMSTAVQWVVEGHATAAKTWELSILDRLASLGAVGLNVNCQPSTFMAVHCRVVGRAIPERLYSNGRRRMRG